MNRRVEPGGAHGACARPRHRPDDGVRLVLRRAVDRQSPRGEFGHEGETRRSGRYGLHARSLRSRGDEDPRRAVRPLVRQERYGGASPRLLPRQLRVLRGRAQGRRRCRRETARLLPRLDGLVSRQRLPHAQRGARGAIQLARLLQTRRHSRDGDVRPRRPRHPHLEVRFVRRAREGDEARLFRKLHVDRRALPRASRRDQALPRPTLSRRRQSRLLSRALLLARRRRLAGLDLLRLPGDESAQSDLARNGGPQRVRDTLPVALPDLERPTTTSRLCGIRRATVRSIRARR